jgi:poly(3-hydroxybutyrate) depolymerase
MVHRTLRIKKLQRYQIDPMKVVVAGISSGGFAAVQMHVAHSSTFKGAAIYAGGVYWCAGAGGAATALANCGGSTLPSNQASYNTIGVRSISQPVDELDRQRFRSQSLRAR